MYLVFANKIASPTEYSKKIRNIDCKVMCNLIQ